MGQNGPTKPGPRKLGQETKVPVVGQAIPGIRRPIRFDIPPLDRKGEMGRQDLLGERVQLGRLLGEHGRQVRQHDKRAEREREERRDFEEEIRGARERRVRRDQGKVFEFEWRGEKRKAFRDALHGMRALHGRSQSQ